MATTTWHDLKDWIEIGEESITDYKLLGLRREIPHAVRVKKFNRQQEGKIGADWEWWFGNGGEWYGMRVQAKKISDDWAGYSHIDHHVGGKEEKPLQRHVLIDKARENGLFPAYSFYNYWPASKNKGCECNGSFEEALWGVSVAAAVGVDSRTAEHRSKVETINEIALPISCLVCCRGLPTVYVMRDLLPHRVEAMCRRLVVMANIGSSFKGSIVTTSPPAYVTDANQSDTTGRDIDGVLIVEERLDDKKGAEVTRKID